MIRYLKETSMCLTGVHGAQRGRWFLTNKRTTCPRMHSVQEELSRHLYHQVKSKTPHKVNTQMRFYINLTSLLSCFELFLLIDEGGLSLTPQCSRQPGPCVGGAHLARQLWTLPELEHQTPGRVRGKESPHTSFTPGVSKAFSPRATYRRIYEGLGHSLEERYVASYVQL